MFLGMGPFELVMIVIVVLIIFGPKNLPKLGKSLGKTVKGIRDGMDEATSEAKGDEPASSEAADVHVEDADAPATDEDKKFCPECGAENPAENKFCKKCGHKLD